jgi:dolichol-phosphate mannosyltransferase
MKLSVVVTALNEERNILPAIRNILTALDHFGIEGEIIAINDGSTDKTEELIRQLAAEPLCIKLLSHEKPQGVGASFWDGVEASSGDVVVWMPGDNENDAWEIFRYHQLMQHVDIVIPFIFNKEVRPLYRNALSFIYRFVVNTTFGVYFNYTNGTILYRKSLFKDIGPRSGGFFFQTDILIRAAKKGYLFAEVPYRLNIREHGVSKAVTFPSLIRVAKGYLRLVKDFYFTKNAKADVHFPEDSLTKARRENRRSCA